MSLSVRLPSFIFDLAPHSKIDASPNLTAVPPPPRLPSICGLGDEIVEARELGGCAPSSTRAEDFCSYLTLPAAGVAMRLAKAMG